MAKRLSLYVEDALIEAIDSLVKDGRFNSRNEAIEAALKGFVRNELADRVKRLFDEAIEYIASSRHL